MPKNNLRILLLKKVFLKNIVVVKRQYIYLTR